jgi:3-oxoacyl-[acyl-carrier-protein] synthase III
MDFGRNARVNKTGATEIVGVGYSYPSDIVDNDMFFERCRFDITDDRLALIANTRMKTRRWCAAGENTWTMAREAVAMAMSRSTVAPDEIDCVVVSSCSTIPNVQYPNAKNPILADLSPYVLNELGRNDAVGIDLKGAYCAGFLRGLELMDALLENPNYRAGLVVATDMGGMFATAETNRSAFCFMVGDSAGAVVLRKTQAAPRTGLLDYVGYTDVSKADLIHWGADGRSLFVRGAQAQTAGLELSLDCCRKLLDRNGLTAADVDWLVPSQTHPAVTETICDELGIARDKLIWHGDVTGYSASASIPCCLAERICEGLIRKGDLVLSVAAGAGMNCAGALFFC